MNKNALPKGWTSAPNSQRTMSVPESNEAGVLRTTLLDLAFVQALEATLGEWSSAADDAAFEEL